jgi:hypothetical protein
LGWRARSVTSAPTKTRASATAIAGRIASTNACVKTACGTYARRRPRPRRMGTHESTGFQGASSVNVTAALLPAAIACTSSTTPCSRAHAGAVE